VKQLSAEIAAGFALAQLNLGWIWKIWCLNKSQRIV